MSGCANCGTEIVLKGDISVCPSCQSKEIFYCNNCKETIDTKNQPECKCGFFVCQHCGQCGPDCSMVYVWDDIRKLLGSVDNKEEIIKELQQKTLTGVKGKLNTECERGVPKSYAVALLRKIAIKLQGYNVKDRKDYEAFKNLFDKLEEKQIGDTWTINQMKKEGTHGQEMREASYLFLCLGLAQKEKVIDEKNKKSYIQFKRCRKDTCKYACWEGLVSKYCSKCEKGFNNDATICDSCGGMLKQRISHSQFCSRDKKEFKPIKKEEEEGGKEKINCRHNRRTCEGTEREEETGDNWQDFIGNPYH